jgi:hypothetical protein
MNEEMSRKLLDVFMQKLISMWPTPNPYISRVWGEYLSTLAELGVRRATSKKQLNPDDFYVFDPYSLVSSKTTIEYAFIAMKEEVALKILTIGLP